MRGVYAELCVAALGVLFLALLVSSVWWLVNSPQENRTNVLHKRDVDKRPGLWAGVLISFALSIGWAGRLAGEIRFHRDLSQLTPTTVESITVGDKVVTNRQQVTSLVEALNKADWYEMRRGDAADEVSFVVKLKSGKLYDYKVTRYQRGPGAVLIPQSPAGWSYGEAFCPELPDLLTGSSIALPPCLSYGTGKPVHCTVE